MIPAACRVLTTSCSEVIAVQSVSFRSQWGVEKAELLLSRWCRWCRRRVERQQNAVIQHHETSEVAQRAGLLLRVPGCRPRRPTGRHSASFSFCWALEAKMPHFPQSAQIFGESILKTSYFWAVLTHTSNQCGGTLS